MSGPGGGPPRRLPRSRKPPWPDHSRRKAERLLPICSCAASAGHSQVVSPCRYLLCGGVFRHLRASGRRLVPFDDAFPAGAALLEPAAAEASVYRGHLASLTASRTSHRGHTAPLTPAPGRPALLPRLHQPRPDPPRHRAATSTSRRALRSASRRSGVPSVLSCPANTFCCQRGLQPKSSGTRTSTQNCRTSARLEASSMCW